MARIYHRDSRGRFASGGGGSSSRGKPVTLARRKPVSQGGGKSRGHLLKRQAVKDARRKLAAKDPADRSVKGTLSRRSQKGAVTRAQRQLQAAQQGGRVRLSGRAGVLRPGARKAPSVNDLPASDSATKGAGSSRSQAGSRGKTGKKVDVQIRRAGVGGEYGPDGHFYPAGSWMPAGKFVGANQQGKGIGGKASGANDKGKDGESGSPRVIRQKRPEPPIVRPTGKSVAAPTGLSKRAEANRGQVFDSSGYVYISSKKSRYGERTVAGLGNGGGWMHTAAVASRLTPNQMSQAIKRLRGMAKDKAKFDDSINYRFNSFSDRKQAHEDRRVTDSAYYHSARRGGYLPRGMKPGQYLRAEQLIDAVWHIAGQRSSRPNNRRTGQEEFAWVFNNILGSKAPRSRSTQSVVRSSGPKRYRMTSARQPFRPLSTRKMIQAGGSPWQKGAHDRIYFNNDTGGKIFYDKNSRRMTTQGGNKKTEAMARTIERAARVAIPKRWTEPRRRR